MADNLGTLWFGADIDLNQLKQKIQQGNQNILDALKMNYDPQSYQNMVNNLRSALNNETFQIKISTDAQNVAQNLRQQFSSITSGGQGVNLSGLTGINGMTRDILDQKSAIRDTKAEVDALKEAWQRAAAQYGKNSMQARAAQSAYDRANRDLRTSRYELSGMNIERGRATLAQKALNDQMRQASAAAKQLSSDHLRLNTTLAGGIHISTQLGSALSSLFAVHAAKQFLDNVIEIGGQLEKQRISMGAIIGDTARANELFEQIKDLAIKSPFGVVELDQYSKQLAAYGIEQSKLFDMTKRLADISAGAGQDIGRLALALGHVKSATYLTGITLRQFSMNNIPMLKMLADYYTEVEKRAVSTAEVQKRISNRQVSYEDVEEQIKRMTDEGGQFFNMQEKISESLSAKFKNLKDSFDIMYGEIAESKVGDFLKGIASILTSMSRNWKEFAVLIGAAAAAIGTYKLALLPVNKAMMQFGQETVLTSTRLNAQRIAMGLSTAETKALSAATIDVMVKQGLLSKQQLLTAVATKKLTVAQAELAATNFNVTKGELLRIASMGRLGLAMRSLTVGVKSLGVALKGLMFNPFTIVLTAITAAAELFMHFKNKSDEAKQSVKDMVNTANEGFENIQDVLKKFPEKVLDAGTMSGGIKEITEALKNYAPNANNILEEANAIADLAERYAFLRGELKSTENAYADLENTADYVVNANNKTGNLINDTFTEQVEDYLGDLREVRKAEQEFMYHRIAINNALEKIAKGVPEFAKGRYDEEGNLKSLKEQIELLKNIQIPNVGSAFSQFSQVLASSNNDASVALNKWSAALSDADKRMRDEVLPDLIKFAQKLDDSYKGTKGWGENWKQNGDHVKTAIIAITKELEKVPDMTDTVKNELLDKIFNEQWHLDIKFTTEEAEEELTGWQKEMQDYFDKNHIYIRLSMSSTREDVIKQIEAERKKAQEIADNAGQVLIGIGFKLNKLPTNLPTPLATPWNQNALEDYQQQTDYVNKLNAAIDKYNLNVNNKAAEKARKAAESAANKAEREAEKRSKERTKMAEAQLKIDEELAKQRLELEDAIADAEVAAIKNNSARERAQRLNEMRKQERDLKKQVEEWKKTAFKALKEKYEADPNNKKVSFYDTPDGKAGWQGIPLTKEQEETYKQRWATMLATGEKSLKELVRAEHKANADAIQKYIEQFGTYEEKKKAIYEKANDEICDLQEQLTDDMTDEDRQAIDARIALVKKGAQDQVDELDVKYGKAKAILIDLFEDASEKSITEIEKIIKKYEALVKYLKGEDNVSREDLISFGFTEKEIDKIVEKIEKEGVSSIKDFTEQIKKLKGELGNRSPWMAFSVNIEKAIEKIKNAKGENKGSEIGTGLEEIGRSIQDILPSVESFGESVANMFQTNDADFRQTIQRLKDLGGLVEGIGKIASKDYFGGIMQAGQSLINIIGSFSAQKEQEKEEAKQERLERLRNSIEAANDSIQRLTEELEKSYGVEALRLEEEQKKRVAENQKRAVKGLNELGLGSLDETFNFFDNQWQSAAGAIGARYGKQFGLSWLSWTKDALDNDIIKDYADDFRLSIESIEKLSELGNQYVWYPVTGLNGSWEELLKDPEKLAKTLAYIRKFDEGLWGDLIAINDETAEWLTALADSADQWEKIELKAKEQITGTSFDSVFDSFMNGLYEFANGTEDAFGDIADNWQKMINKMVINNLIGQKVKEELQAWYKLWDAAYTGDKDIDEDELAELQKKYNKIWTDAESEIKTMTEKGIIKPIEESTSSAESAFKDLRSSFLDTLMDMEGDAKDFRKKMEEIMVKDLIEKNVFSKAFTIGDEAYKNLDEYITKWNERYADAVAKNDTVLIDQLLDELVKVRELTIKEAEALRERLKDIAEDEDDTTFSGLSDSWVSTLMDMSKTAEDWAEDIGKTMAEKIIKEMVVPTMLQPLLDDLQSVFDTTLANATTTDADGNKTYDWDQVIQSPELFEEIDRLTRAYPKAQEIIKKIMDAFGLDTSYYKHEGFSNLGDSIIDSLKSVDGSVEDWSKEQGKKMAEQMAQAYVDEIYGSKISELNEAWQNALDNGDDNAMKAIERELETLYRKMADDPRLQEFIAKFKELADNPFKDMAKEFTQSLMDMEQTTEDFGLSIARNLTEQMIDKIIGDSYQAQIDALGNQWAEALKNGDTAAIERIKQEMMKLRDQMGEAVQPLLDAIKEIDEQTDTTFKDMTDSWVSALMDMDKTAEDWAQEVGKMMAQKIITEMIAPVYIQPLLNSMQEAFNNAMAVSGATFQSVMSAMTPFIEDIKEKFDEIRPVIEEIFGGFGIVTEAVEEVEEAVDEVEYALGDLKSEFSSALMDMESTAESFSKNIKNILAKTFVEKFILGEKFDAMMEQWQQQFEGILTGSMSDDQRKKSIQKLADSMTDYEQSLVGPVMSLLESLGLTAESNQEATMNMADKITYDQADQLLGINIAQELTLEQILAELKGGAVIQTSPYKLPVSTVTNDDGDEQLTATLLSMIDLTRIGNDNILSQFTMANDHLRMIQEYQRKINNEVSTHLASIDMKLNNLSRL